MSDTLVNIVLINEIKAVLQSFDPIGLKEMSSVALMKRLDTKFILSADRLPTLFEAINDDYAALKIEEKLIFGYRTTYYDSTGLETYTDHLRGKSIRHKIRIREYLDTAVNYFEIKKKKNSGVTDKVRMRIHQPNALPVQTLSPSTK